MTYTFEAEVKQVRTMDFQNRIIGHGEEPIDEILFNPANWRIHPKEQQDALTGVLEQVGYVQDVIINKTTGRLVDGHLRCQIAAKHGEKTIPCVYVELSEEEEALVLATIDRISAMAATDKAKLEELMHMVQSDNANVQKLMSEIAEKERIDFGGGGLDMGGLPEAGSKDESDKMTTCPKCGFKYAI